MLGLFVIEILLGDLVVMIELTRLFLRVGIREGDCAVLILIPTPETFGYFLSILLSDFISSLDDGVFLIVLVS